MIAYFAWFIGVILGSALFATAPFWERFLLLAVSGGAVSFAGYLVGLYRVRCWEARQYRLLRAEDSANQ